ncbi:alpha/beta hydrolase [Rhodocytophaga rosea]|uniref:Alpha/beta hydrolase n=1 Tax=Rhodocytophaga rosea TaxID=2704465 RepID=A0A6C0GH34_9BACT|nr:alpha/beta hydrolase [Rhodocytophaga rosea]QHT67195.1 alpha/beta hydrolase [Rhodocytophaga rosea]
MHKFYFLLLAVFICTSCYSQKIETVYLNPKDSTSSFYIIVYPPKLPGSGFMFLMPGMFQKPQEVIQQTELPKIAARQGILTIIPVFSTGISTLGIDTATQASFREMLNHVTSRHKLIDQRFYVGGFSIGGTCAIKYAQLALSHNYPIKPSAVFAIDAPLDFERMYNTSVREMRSAGMDKDLLAENTYMLKRYEKEFGGPPSDFLPYYHKGSPYSFSDTTHQTLQPLIHVPIRLYTEPDVQWWLKAGVDYSGMNAFDCAAMTNDLHRMGSKKVMLISTTNKGYRKPGNKRNPHSWSIAEPNDLVKWLLAQR